MTSRVLVCAVIVGVGLLLAVPGCKSYYSSKLCARPSMGSDADSLPAATSAETADGDEPAETAGVEQTTNITDRLMTYDATLAIVVQDLPGALDTLKAMGLRLKGYMQSMTQNSIVLRIPATRLQEALHQTEALGEMTAREIKGTDVTEEMLDLDIRLRNLQEMHERLVKLLDKGDKVEDLLKIEKELERVTEQLEQLKGRVKYLSHAIAYSTLTVTLNSPVSPSELQDVIPFAWVRNLGADIVLPPDASFAPKHHWRSWLRMDLPPGYVKLYESDGCTRAMSGSGVMLLVQREPNFEGGTPEFWAPLVRRGLVAGKAIAVTGTNDVALATGAHGFAVEGKRTAGARTFAYRIAAIVTRDFVYTIEYWGLADEGAKDRDALDRACQSVAIRP